MLEAATAEAARRHASEAASVIKRGLGERAILDITAEEVHCLTVLLLARYGKVTEGLQSLYGVLELLEDAEFLKLPSEQQFEARESELQRLLVVLPETGSVKSEVDALKAHAQALEAAAKQRGQRGREPLTPLHLWRRQYGESTPPPARKMKPPPTPPENAWHLLAPDRAPQSIAKGELSKMFKKWMLKNHPDKGGDEYLAARVSSQYSRALGAPAAAARLHAHTARRRAQDGSCRGTLSIAAHRRARSCAGRDQTTDEERDEDTVYRQLQQVAEGEWGSYKRQCSEQTWSASQAFLDQRLLKGMRWHLGRAVKQADYIQELAQVMGPLAGGVTCPSAGSVGRCDWCGARAIPSALTLASCFWRLQADATAPTAEPLAPLPPQGAAAEGTPRKGLRKTASSPTLSKGSPNLAFGSRAPPTAREKAREGSSASIVFENCTAEGEGLHAAFPKTAGAPRAPSAGEGARSCAPPTT